jgi:transcription antitermination protein NusB
VVEWKMRGVASSLHHSITPSLNHFPHPLSARPARSYTLAVLNKRKMRELAMQVLFVWDAHGERDPEIGRRAVSQAGNDVDVQNGALEMAAGAWEGRAASDQWVERLAPQWPPRRQPGVDRNILRLAVWELTHADTPPKVVIDEAIELAKHFSTGQSPAFVNGVLDAVLKERQALTGDDKVASSQ